MAAGLADLQLQFSPATAPSPSRKPFQQTKPAVPRRHEKPVMGLKSNKNYVKQNALENKTAKPKQVKAKMIDAAGQRFDAEESG